MLLPFLDRIADQHLAAAVKQTHLEEGNSSGVCDVIIDTSVKFHSCELRNCDIDDLYSYAMLFEL